MRVSGSVLFGAHTEEHDGEMVHVPEITVTLNEMTVTFTSDICLGSEAEAKEFAGVLHDIVTGKNGVSHTESVELDNDSSH